MLMRDAVTKFGSDVTGRLNAGPIEFHAATPLRSLLLDLYISGSSRSRFNAVVIRVQSRLLVVNSFPYSEHNIPCYVELESSMPKLVNDVITFAEALACVRPIEFQEHIPPYLLITLPGLICNTGRSATRY
ncbi:hypothetical protein K0M31_017303 [Melipona bicolor]|uniref:Uncharacterized protein n=1 Tax=Melipona bicolor TaxID=60889 RepID=A0AA40G4L1_9HYME|nr:hypothetical protein K0M31_017303 [Melipona bicolor]